MRLELTRKTDLAVRSIRALHKDGGRVPGRDLAKLVGTTTPFIAQVVPPLVQAGWIDSRPGPTGGYSLAADPSGISFLDVIEAIEGRLEEQTCILAGGPCDAEFCSLHDAWTEARKAMCESFSHVRLVEG